MEDVVFDVGGHEGVGVGGGVRGVAVVAVVDEVDVGEGGEEGVFHEGTEVFVGAEETVEDEEVPGLVVGVDQGVEFERGEGGEEAVGEAEHVLG